MKESNADKNKLDESVQEMNELVESDEELNGADCERDTEYDDERADVDSLSLWNSDEDRDRVRKRKDVDAKVNNSFTGPYPLDPTDFNHTDKGPNNQFWHLTHALQ